MKVLLLTLLVALTIVSSDNKFLRLRNSSNDSNNTNTTSTRYVFHNKYEYNHNQIYVNYTNNSLPNSSNVSTNATFIHNRNFYTVEQRFFHGSNDTYETFYQNVFRNESSSYLSDGLHVFLDTIYYTKHIHYYVSNDFLNNTIINNFTSTNYTVGNTVFSTENHFGYFTRHYNAPITNVTNNKYYSKKASSSYQNNTPIFTNHSNSSNTTNHTIILEHFNHVDNNYYRKYFNFTQSHTPCNYQSQPFCINETISFNQFTNQNEFVNGSFLVQNITHTAVRNNFFNVYYNPWYGMAFFDVHYNRSLNESWEYIYVNNTY